MHDQKVTLRARGDQEEKGAVHKFLHVYLLCRSLDSYANNQINVELTNEGTEILYHLVSHWSILESNVNKSVKQPAKHVRYH